jgi:hypothetical protein
LGNNGREAFLQKYNSTKMEQELYKIHENLLKNQYEDNCHCRYQIRNNKDAAYNQRDPK